MATDSTSGSAPAQERGPTLGGRLDAGSVQRMLGYGAVGVTGIAVDLSVVWGFTHLAVHYTATTIVAYLVAMTWNFAWHRRYVFEASADGLLREYGRYFTVDSGAFLIRLTIVALLMELHVIHGIAAHLGVDPLLPVSIVGIGAAFLAGFAATEKYVFGN